MTKGTRDPYGAAEQSLGYLYQARYALLRLLTLPEDSSILIEKDDDLDFVDQSGIKTLGSLKHRALGNRLTDLSTDFWKSVRIWLDRYDRDKRVESNLRFFLFTTGEIADDSFLQNFQLENDQDASLRQLVEDALATSTSQTIALVAGLFAKLSSEEKDDFLSRVTIVGTTPRIDAIPQIIIDQHMRTVRREFRAAVFERLEGWWQNVVVELLTGTRTDAVVGFEISDKMSSLADEYKLDNLPINFRGKRPVGAIDPDVDPRVFVVQLREIGISSARIQSAILDYYRAFEQRSSWARENVLVAGEVEEYEDRLADEWQRYKDVAFELLDEESPDDLLLKAGQELYRWAEFETDHIRIRERVSEPYVVRGGFHILANALPTPRVFWHPRFLERLNELMVTVP